MKAVLVLVLCFAAVALATSVDTQSAKIQKLKELVTDELLERASADQIMRLTFQKMERQLMENRVLGAHCSPKLEWKSAGAPFKGTKDGKGLTELAAEVIPTDRNTFTLYIGGEVGIAAAYGISAGLGLAFEFSGGAGKWVGISVALCVNADFSLGLQVGGKAEVKACLYFDSMDRMDDLAKDVCSVGFDVAVGFKLGLEFMIACDKKATDAFKAEWDKTKQQWKDANGFAAGIKAIAKGTIRMTTAAVTGFCASYGVGFGAEFDLVPKVKLADLIPDLKLIATKVKDWAASKWEAFKAWVKK